MGSPMNYQSVGVKGYTSLDHAKLPNLSLNANYDILPHLHWNGMLTYARAMDDTAGNLPYIRPLSYQNSLYFMHKGFGIKTSSYAARRGGKEGVSPCRSRWSAYH